MSDDRKKPLWPWIVALLIGLPMLYVASFWPACRLVGRKKIPSEIPRMAYRPILWVITEGRPSSIVGPAQRLLRTNDHVFLGFQWMAGRSSMFGHKVWLR